MTRGPFCRSSEWGTQPMHWYFTSALPRSLLAGLPLGLLGCWMDRRLWTFLGTTLSYVALYSALPHKEVRHCSWNAIYLYYEPKSQMAESKAVLGSQLLWVFFHSDQALSVHLHTCRQHPSYFGPETIARSVQLKEHWVNSAAASLPAASAADLQCCSSSGPSITVQKQRQIKGAATGVPGSSGASASQLCSNWLIPSCVKSKLSWRPCVAASTRAGGQGCTGYDPTPLNNGTSMLYILLCRVGDIKTQTWGKTGS